MKILINGDSHTAGAEAVNAHAFAEDDHRYKHLHRQPHPDNLRASWGQKLGEMLNMGTTILAESASSNDRILRTTNEWLNNHGNDVFVIIQWSTWEREEWLIDGHYHQITASGLDSVPDSHRQKYKEFVADGWNGFRREHHWHVRIRAFHEYLTKQHIPHLFFNGNSRFKKVKAPYDWGLSYWEPYTSSYHDWLQHNGHRTVSSDSYHYDEKAHGAWARHMMRHILDNKLI
jgi:hypothetical protein